jgi:plastocyanin
VRILALQILGTVLVLHAGCTEAAESPPASPDAVPSSVEVLACEGVTPVRRIKTRTTGGVGFDPTETTIDVDQVIVFEPSSFHDMVSGTPASRDGLFDSGEPGDTACLRFSVAGTFPFFCSVHSSMRGTVTVR